MIRFTRLVVLVSLFLVIGLTACALAPRVTQGVAGLTTQAADLLALATAIPTQTYIVQSGDTPLGVALMFGTTVDALIELNTATHPEMGWVPMKFNAGWQMLVPAQTMSNSAAPDDSNLQVIQSPVTVTGVPLAAQVQDTNGSSFDYDGALEIVRLTNDERAKAGLGPLALDETLMAIARKRATEIVSDWGHQGLDDDCDECGENIIKGGSVIEQVQWWMSSDGHRGGILWPDYTAMGVGRYIVNGKAYAVQLFR